MKYLLLIPVLGYYVLRDAAVFLKQGELVRGLLIFILIFISLLAITAWLQLAGELNRVRKQIGNSAYEQLSKGIK